LYFHDQLINGVKITYRRMYHDQLIQQLLQQLGEPVKEKNEDHMQRVDERTILRWDTSRGNVFIKKVLQEKEESALMWFPYPTG
jgi:hypothetical protein